MEVLGDNLAVLRLAAVRLQPKKWNVLWFSRGDPKQQAAKLNDAGPTNGQNVELRPRMVASFVFQLVI